MLRSAVVSFLFFASISQACIVGPEKIEPSESLGFEITLEDIDLCKHCKLITINAPSNFRGEPISHGIVSVFLNSELISKSVSKVSSEDDSSTINSVANFRDGISYKIEIEYGRGRCKSYQFDFSGVGIEI